MRCLIGPIKCLVLLCGALLLSTPVSASERILSFDSEITINTDSSVNVVETIKVKAEGRNIKRGIYRSFPKIYILPDGQRIEPILTMKNVLKNGISEPYHIRMENGYKNVYIGHKDVFLRPGIYSYTIEYSFGRAVLFKLDHDEMPWNVTGNEWKFPIDRISARVYLPAGAEAINYTAYTGYSSAKGKKFTAKEMPDGSVLFETTDFMPPRSGLTVAVSWPRGYVTEAKILKRPVTYVRRHDGYTLPRVGVVANTIMLCYFLLAWYFIGRDRRGDRVIVPHFEPPKSLSPALCAYIRWMGSIPPEKCFSIALISMAAKGAVKIKKEGKAYRIIKQNGDQGKLSVGEKRLYGDLLGFGRKSKLIGKEYSLTVDRAFRRFKEKTIQESGTYYFKKNLFYFLPGVFLGVFFMMSGLYKANAPTAFLLFVSFVTMGGVLIPHILIGFIHEIRGGFKSSILNLRFAFFLVVVWGVIFIVCTLFKDGAMTVSDILLGIEFFVMGTIMVLFYELMKVPTLKGRKVMDEIEGFEMFLATAEKERFKALHPPEMTPELFEEYYPYAVAFGVEEAWAKKFETSVMATTRLKPENYEPSWYSGGRFSSHGFTAGMNSSLKTAVIVPASSSGSGGFSGGGFGGGGGGGW